MFEDLYDERRKSQRRHLIYYLKLFDIDADQLLGNLVDITTEGLMLVSEHPLEKGEQYHLKLVLPKKVLGKKAIDFRGRCLWCQEDVNPGLFAAGLQFTQITGEDQLVIEVLVRRHGFQD